MAVQYEGDRNISAMSKKEKPREQALPDIAREE